jgi:hypothetical protein
MELEGSLPRPQVPATFPILSQLDPVHAPTSHFLWYLNKLDKLHDDCVVWKLHFSLLKNSCERAPLPHPHEMLENNLKGSFS